MHLDAINIALAQLIIYKKNGKGASFIDDDIAGYKEILSSGNPEINSQRFIKLKRSLRERGVHYGSNLKVIEKMKSKNIWIK